METPPLCCRFSTNRIEWPGLAGVAAEGALGLAGRALVGHFRLLLTGTLLPCFRFSTNGIEWPGLAGVAVEGALGLAGSFV